MIIDTELIENYSQKRFDFKSDSLDKNDILRIKSLAEEKRAEYGIGPIGRDIFRYIREKEPNIFFEKEPFDNKDLDAVLFLPDPNKNNAYIILNSNQPLFNQIFATAHEYYHYIEDLETVKQNPKVCSMSSLGDKSEQKASRFAAEFLLPEQALKKVITRYLSIMNLDSLEQDIAHIAAICYALTIRYCMPVKAILFRLCEEGYIKDEASLISNYEFVKNLMREIKTQYSRELEELLSNENPYIEEVMYKLIPKAYNSGFVSLEQVIEDAEALKLNIEDIMETLDIETDIEDDEDINDDIRENLLKKIREMEQ